MNAMANLSALLLPVSFPGFSPSNVCAFHFVGRVGTVC